MQTDLPKMWNWLANSTFCGDNDYTSLHLQMRNNEKKTKPHQKKNPKKNTTI